jgi:hypothetical protein
LDLAKKEGLCCLLSVSMVERGKAVGVIKSYTYVPHVFTREGVKGYLIRSKKLSEEETF